MWNAWFHAYLFGALGLPLPDSDQDGYTLDEGDCDDTNPNIHPGAPELCDSLDWDCDGADGLDDPACDPTHPPGPDPKTGCSCRGSRRSSGAPWLIFLLPLAWRRRP